MSEPTRHRIAWFIGMGVVFSISPSSAAPSEGEKSCAKTTRNAKNADGTQLILTESVCSEQGERRIEVFRIPSGGNRALVLRRTQELAKAPYGGAQWLDLEYDGVHEVEIRGSCGAGPNCESALFKLTRDGQSMQLYYSGGNAGLSMIDGYLVESGRASCCAWEHHAYRSEPNQWPITERDQEFQITIEAPADDPAQPAAVCEFRQRRGEQWTRVAPPSIAWLSLCEQYGKKYRVLTVDGP